jgi:hypothetical protein
MPRCYRIQAVLAVSKLAPFLLTIRKACLDLCALFRMMVSTVHSINHSSHVTEPQCSGVTLISRSYDISYMSKGLPLCCSEHQRYDTILYYTKYKAGNGPLCRSYLREEPHIVGDNKSHTDQYGQHDRNVAGSSLDNLSINSAPKS